MRIISLIAENVKKLVAIEIRPDGNVVQITGRNGQGKTSVLDCIWWALAGTEHIQSQPIRKGATEARIRLDLGELVVTRTFKEGKTSTLRVENAEGAKYPSPQAMLDKLLGALTFDPLEFSRMKPRDQFDTLRGFVPGVDFDEIEALYRRDYELRTGHNRTAKHARDVLVQMPPAPAVGDYPPRVDVSALVTKLEDAGTHNTGIETRKANRQRLLEKAATHKEAAAAAFAQAEKLREQIKALNVHAAHEELDAESIEQRLAEAGDLPAPIDTAGVRAEIDAANASNRKIDEIEAREARRAELLGLVEANESAATELTAAMEKRGADAAAAIKAAQLPVEGINLADNMIFLNGVPLDQASDAEKLRVSVAIAMAMNPKLRVLRIRDGSLLDTDALLQLRDVADKNDFQVWIERVNSSGKVGFVLEDGHLRAPEPEPMEAAAE